MGKIKPSDIHFVYPEPPGYWETTLRNIRWKAWKFWWAITDNAIPALLWVWTAFIVWVAIAGLVFIWRHPWATAGHRLRCYPEMLMFEEVVQDDCDG